MRTPSRILATLAAALLPGILTTPASAASPVTGTISCSVLSVGSPTHPSGILFHPFLDATPRLVRLGGINNGSSCDGSTATGGKAPITGVAFKLGGLMPDGTCTELTTAPQWQNGHLKLKWRGVNPAGHSTTIATTKAEIATTSYDSGTHTLTIVTAPLKGHAFVGKTATLKLGFDSYVDAVEAGCPGNGGILGENFGETNPSTLDVE